MDNLVSTGDFLELQISTSHTFSRCISCRIFVYFVYNYSVASIKVLEKKAVQEVSSIENEGALIMGIHYDYKSTRGDKAMKKEAKRKARIEQRRAKKLSAIPKESEKETMHDINKPITLEDLTNPDKN